MEFLLECVLGLDPAPPSPGCVTLGKTRTNLCFSSHICEGSRVIQPPSWVVVRIKWVTIFTCFEQLRALSESLVLEVGKAHLLLWWRGLLCILDVIATAASSREGSTPRPTLHRFVLGSFQGLGIGKCCLILFLAGGSRGVEWVGSVQFLGTH